MSSEFCLEIAKLFELLEAKTRAEFNKALENMKTDIESGNSLQGAVFGS